jgi:HD-GYP domain-containing protein (c-di-GMP phosphodiesterase class II)
MFLASGVNIDKVFDGIDSDASFRQVMYETPMTEQDVDKYIEMIVFSIDFRSSQTVIHTVAATCVAGFLAALSGVDEDEIEMIKTGAMLHDIGKIGIPVHILESTDRLSDSDMAIMRTHVGITEQILEGSVHDVVRHVAVKHHEKLDGSGYPGRLSGHDIAFFDRIVAVADILSALYGARTYKDGYPKERIIGLLNDMSEQKLLDSKIVALSVGHYDEIIEAVERDSQPVIQVYNAINAAYLRKMDEIKSLFPPKRM